MDTLGGLAIAGHERRRETATRRPGPNPRAMDWDDVRVFLAVAREGSMRAACVRAVIDWVKALFAEQRDVLAGNR